MIEMTFYSLESILSIFADKYNRIITELINFKNGKVWDYLCKNFNGNPLENIDELLNNEKMMKELFESLENK
jgi:hypothetical protein